MRTMVMNQVNQHFRPEFLNRLDDVVMFSALTTEHLFQICSLMVQEIGTRLESRNIKLSLDPSAAHIFISEAYDPLYGARPLRRYLEKKIVTELSRMLLDTSTGRLPDDSLVTITGTQFPVPSNALPSHERNNIRFIITPLAPPEDQMQVN